MCECIGLEESDEAQEQNKTDPDEPSNIPNTTTGMAEIMDMLIAINANVSGLRQEVAEVKTSITGMHLYYVLLHDVTN